MAKPVAAAGSAARPVPTVWGLSPVQLHDHFWAARGVQVVRVGEASEIVDGAELFLLTDPRSLAVFRLRPLLERLSWVAPQVLWVRLRDGRERDLHERLVQDAEGRFLRFERLYDTADTSLARVALTPDVRVARLWQQAETAREGWRLLRHQVPSARRAIAAVTGHVYDRSAPAETCQFVHDLVQWWPQPGATIRQTRAVTSSVWADVSFQGNAEHCVGPVWIGTGRALPAEASVVGPAVLWDGAASSPHPSAINWEELEPASPLRRPLRRPAWGQPRGALKRGFDLAFALVALLLALPLFPFIMLAIYLEDGRPFFFVHRRETIGGREFPCLKFRTMRRDAEEIKRRLQAENQADGPQFYVHDDPRVTRLGRFLRHTWLDELPQLLNILAGHMSVVGPRPSPRQENQCCPAWREARLSIRPGLTGLWQVMRTRRQGMDFQEWIRFDLEYVDNASLGLDLWIIWRTLMLAARRLV